MGCVSSYCLQRPPGTQQDAAEADCGKQYSWDVRRQENQDPSKFVIEDTLDSEVVKAPGTIKGQQFIVRNCKNTNIYLYDHCNTVSVDDCKDCNIFIGPTKVCGNEDAHIF